MVVFIGGAGEMKSQSYKCFIVVVVVVDHFKAKSCRQLCAVCYVILSVMFVTNVINIKSEEHLLVSI